MPVVNVSPLGPKPQFELSNGTPAVGNKLFFYVAGSVNTKQDTYTDSTGVSANTNPIILNSLGMPDNQLWFTDGQSYKVVYTSSTDSDPPTSPIWTIDDLVGINDVNLAAQSEWIASGLTPTFIGATSFSLVGDQTSTFHVGRRLKTTNSGGTVYSRIITSVFGAVTTVTVVNDTGSLDSGLSAVSYGQMSAVNTSLPGFGATKGRLLVTTPTAGVGGKDPGTDGFLLTPSAGSSDGLAYISPPFNHAANIGFAFSVAGGALTCALKTQAAADATDATAIIVNFPNATVATGTYTVRKVVAALSLVVSSGSTLGHADTIAGPIYHYLIDNAGTVEYAVSNKFFGYYGIVSTTAEGGAGGADSASTMYSTTARTNVPFVCIGRTRDTQTTAGTWAAVPSEVQFAPFPRKAATIQVFTGTGANTYTKPWDLFWATAHAQGGGGGGGGSDMAVGPSVGSSGGGGGGGYSRKVLAADVIGPTETATVGAGGTAGAATGTAGGTGGTSSFGAHCSAAGGNGGSGSTTTTIAAAGAGGIGSSGDVNTSGSDGSRGCVSADTQPSTGGSGGSSHLGGGGFGGAQDGGSQAAGSAGNVYGGGGGGATSDTTTGVAGGAGAQGIVFVEEFYV